MAFTHHNWEKSGRTLYDSGTNQYMYKAAIGEEQTWDGLKWVPYLWKAGSNELQYGHNLNNLEFASDKQILKVAAKVICNSMKLFVQAYVSGEWVTQPHGAPTRNLANDYPSEGRCTGYLDFPDAQLSFGAQLPYDLQIGLEVGRSGRAIFGCRLRSPVAGQVRFQVVLDELEKLPTDWEWIWARFDPSKGKEDRRVGIRFKDLEWRWTYDEAPFRNIGVETNPDDTKKVTITMGPFSAVANEWLTVYPDTWAEESIAATNNDCDESSGVDLSGYDNYGDMCGNYNSNDYNIGWRWVNVNVPPNPTSVDTGTQIEYDSTWRSGSFDPICYGLEGDLTNDFATTAPSTYTRTTASKTITMSSYGADQLLDGANFQAVVKEILDTGWTQDDNMGFEFAQGDAASQEYFQVYEVESTASGAPARLTIVYTVAAALEIDEFEAVGLTEDIDVVLPDSLGIDEFEAVSVVEYTEGRISAVILEVNDVITTGEDITAEVVGVATLDQEGFRWRLDDDTEAAATWKETQDVDSTVLREVNTRLRFLINASGNPVSKQFKIQYKKTSEATWRDMPESL